jgi:serine protease AprX
MISRNHIFNKIDPELIRTVRTTAEDNISVILHLNKNKECLKSIEKIGLKVKRELPLINAYHVEAPRSKLEEVAAFSEVRYISPDVLITTQGDAPSK